MKKFLCFCSIIASALVLSSCTENTIGADEYFVRYISNGLSRRYDVTYSDEVGNEICLRSIVGETFERIIGPVEKGYTAKFSVKNATYGENATVRIEVKKNNAPFVVKKDGIDRVQYTIE